MSNNVLEVANLSKTFGGTRALAGLSLEVQAGEVRAVLGENGSGKSTLIKILAGFHHPDPGGSVYVAGTAMPFGNSAASLGLGLRFVHQNLALVDNLSIEDNLALTNGFPVRLGLIRGITSRGRVTGALNRVGIELDPRTPVARLTPAEKTGVAVARALSGMRDDDATVLVLDEPTATLPDPEVARILEIVRAVQSNGIAVLYVTHRLEEVFKIASRVTILRDGRHLITTDLGGMTRADLVHLMVGSQLDEVHREAGNMGVVTGRPALEVVGLRTARLGGISLSVAAGDVVGVAGITGSGREELCGCIFGADPVGDGQVRVSGAIVRPLCPTTAIRHGVAYIPGDRQNLGILGPLSARENLSITNERLLSRALIDRRKERRATAEWFMRLSVRPKDGFEQPLGAFSGGNQQKLVFAKWLQRRPKVLLLDEPTQGVDVATKALLHQQLLAAAAAGAAVLVSSSDTDELAALCQRVAILHGGRITAVLTGDRITPSTISQRLLHPPENAEVLV